MAAELSIMDVLLFVLSVLFVGISFAMRRLRSHLEADMRKNVVPFMGMHRMFKKIDYSHKKKKR
jgi:hypothetical protein